MKFAEADTGQLRWTYSKEKVTKKSIPCIFHRNYLRFANTMNGPGTFRVASIFLFVFLKPSFIALKNPRFSSCYMG
jgi:hypothetical protein